MQITLLEWADRNFGETKPSLRTMRRWAAEGKLKPSPVKIGRTLYIQPNAEFHGMTRAELSKSLERLK